MTTSSNAPRPSCPKCVLKHLSQACVLFQESLQGYPEHRWLAIGHMAEAEAEAQSLNSSFAELLRNERKQAEDGLTVPNVEGIMNTFIKILGLNKEVVTDRVNEENMVFASEIIAVTKELMAEPKKDPSKGTGDLLMSNRQAGPYSKGPYTTKESRRDPQLRKLEETANKAHVTLDFKYDMGQPGGIKDADEALKRALEELRNYRNKRNSAMIAGQLLVTARKLLAMSKLAKEVLVSLKYMVENFNLFEDFGIAISFSYVGEERSTWNDPGSPAEIDDVKAHMSPKVYSRDKFIKLFRENEDDYDDMGDDDLWDAIMEIARNGKVTFFVEADIDNVGNYVLPIKFNVSANNNSIRFSNPEVDSDEIDWMDFDSYIIQHYEIDNED